MSIAMAGHRKSPTSTGGIVIGVAAIARLFGRSERTLWRWIKEDGFPAATLPSGHLCTSATLIDLWLLGRLNEVRPNRAGTFGVVAKCDDLEQPIATGMSGPLLRAPHSQGD
jgi:hypothetical protein